MRNDAPGARVGHTGQAGLWGHAGQGAHLGQLQGSQWGQSGQGGQWGHTGQGSQWGQTGQGSQWGQTGQGGQWNQKGQGGQWSQTGNGGQWDAGNGSGSGGGVSRSGALGELPSSFQVPQLRCWQWCGEQTFELVYVAIPRCAAPFLVGKQGKHVRSLAQTTCTKIIVSQKVPLPPILLHLDSRILAVLHLFTYVYMYLAK